MEAIGLAAHEKSAATFLSAYVVRRVRGPRRDRPAQAGPDVQRKPAQSMDRGATWVRITGAVAQRNQRPWLGEW
jgi:hypothetical protein